MYFRPVKPEGKPTDFAIKIFLDQKAGEFNSPAFIPTDPISIPHRFHSREDMEIAGFLAATLSWGQRKTIISSSLRLMQLMDDDPWNFIMHADLPDFKRVDSFVHRTFNGDDCLFFLQSLRAIYQSHGGIETVFTEGYAKNHSILEAITHFRKLFFSTTHLQRSQKHVSDPGKNSSAKRINMFLRWMIRDDERGVDFGLWKSIRPSDLMCPLDLHSGRVARKLGLLHRKQDDWKAVEELTASLRLLDPVDPVKYDFALFGLGVFEKF